MQELQPRQVRTDIRTHACMHTRTHMHLSQIVTAMSRFTASGLNKKDNIHVDILEQTPKSGYICIQFMLLAVIISSVILLVNIIVMSSNTSISSIFMVTLLHQIELEV